MQAPVPGQSGGSEDRPRSAAASARCGPACPGVSDNIRVTSIVDRFLEHSRIFYFGNGGDPQVYIGSADWMDRNLSRRVEVIFPVEQPDLKQRLIDEVSGDEPGGQRQGPRATCRTAVIGGWNGNQTSRPVRSQERFLALAAAAAARRQLPALLPPPTDETPRPLRKKRRHRQTG